MRTWKRADQAFICGKCANAISAGAAMQVVTLPGITRMRIRCEACADGKAPPTLGTMVVRATPANRDAGLTSIRTMARSVNARDWKQVAAGEKK